MLSAFVLVLTLALATPAAGVRLRRSHEAVGTHQESATWITRGTCKMNGCSAILEAAACTTAARTVLSLAEDAKADATVCRLSAEGQPDNQWCDAAPAGCFGSKGGEGSARAFFNVHTESIGRALTFKQGDQSVVRGAICMCGDNAALLSKDNTVHKMGVCGSVPAFEEGTSVDVMAHLDAGNEDDDELEAGNLREQQPFLQLTCAHGYSLTGKIDGQNSISVQCDAQGSLVVENNAGLEKKDFGGKIPECKLVECTDDLFSNLDECVLPGQQQSGFKHGDFPPAIQCNEGHTVDGAPPREDKVNTRLLVECHRGRWFQRLGENGESGLTVAGATGEVSGATCVPVRCPTSEHIWGDKHGSISHGAGVTHEYKSTEVVQCGAGFSLCSDSLFFAESTIASENGGAATPAINSKCTTPSEKRVALLTVTCTATGAWSTDVEATTIEELSCKPMECPQFVMEEGEEGAKSFTQGGTRWMSAFNEDNNALAPKPKMITGPDGETIDLSYFYASQQTPALGVEIACANGWSFTGERNSAREGTFYCGETGAMTRLDGSAEPNADGAVHVEQEHNVDVCKENGCKPVEHHMRKHKAWWAKQHEDGLVNEEEPTALTAVHDDSLDLDCPKGFSYTGLGRRDVKDEAVDQTTNNWERKLKCDKGEYTCLSGWCSDKGTSHDLDCKEVTCIVPGGQVAEEKYKSIAESNPTGSFVVGHVAVFTCLRGHIKDGGAHGDITMESTCTDTWEGKADEYKGWDNGILQCVVDPHYCDEMTEEKMTKRHVASWGSGEDRALNSKRLMVCAEGHTWNDKLPERPTEMEAWCRHGADEAPETGMWTEAEKKCEVVTCTNWPYGGDITSHAEPEREVKGTAHYGDKVGFECATGYRWGYPIKDESNPENFVLPVAVDPAKPSQLTMVCEANGILSFVDEEWKEHQATTECLPLYCAEPGVDPREAARLSNEQLEPRQKNALDLLAHTFAWSSPSGDVGFSGRKFSDVGSLVCHGGRNFPTTCGSDGQFTVDIAGVGVSLAKSAEQLLRRCGKELQVTAPEGGRVIAKECLTAGEGATVSLSGCDNSVADPESSQLWWFDHHGEGCKEFERTASNKVDVLHAWNFCGKVRSLSTTSAEPDMCLAPPKADGAREGPVLAKCSDDSAKWLLNSKHHTLMVYRGPHGEATKEKDQRYEVMFSAVVTTSPEGVTSAKTEMDTYFNYLKENGVTVVSTLA